MLPPFPHSKAKLESQPCSATFRLCWSRRGAEDTERSAFNIFRALWYLPLRRETRACLILRFTSTQKNQTKSHLTSKRTSGDARSPQPGFDQRASKGRGARTCSTQTLASHLGSGTGQETGREGRIGQGGAESGGGGSVTGWQGGRAGRWAGRWAAGEAGAGRGRQGGQAGAGQRDPGPGRASGAVPQFGGDHGKGRRPLSRTAGRFPARLPRTEARPEKPRAPPAPGRVRREGDGGGEAAVTPREATAMSPGPARRDTARGRPALRGKATATGARGGCQRPPRAEGPGAAPHSPAPLRARRRLSRCLPAAARPPPPPLRPREAGPGLTRGQSWRRGQYRARGLAARPQTGVNGSQPMAGRGWLRGRGRSAAGRCGAGGALGRADPAQRPGSAATVSPGPCPAPPGAACRP